MQGNRIKKNGMWEFNINRDVQVANHIATAGIDVKTKKDLIKYLHKAMYCPKKST